MEFLGIAGGEGVLEEMKMMGTSVAGRMVAALAVCERGCANELQCEVALAGGSVRGSNECVGRELYSIERRGREQKGRIEERAPA